MTTKEIEHIIDSIHTYVDRVPTCQVIFLTKHSYWKLFEATKEEQLPIEVINEKDNETRTLWYKGRRIEPYET